MIERVCPIHEVPFVGDKCPKKECSARPVVTTTVYWCGTHKIPLYNSVCPLCGKKAAYLSTDVRPVFPEEKLLLAILTKQDSPLAYDDKSIWCGNSGYYVDGKKLNISIKKLNATPLEYIQEAKALFDDYRSKINKEFFNRNIADFIKANVDRYNEISDEAITYIQSFSDNYDLDDMFVSFSGGKDSTVTSDLVTRAFSTNSITHIFGDTTLEFPLTYEYREQ